ncbi:MAG: DUF3108 domain-containing protein [Dysgonamonadaceae bacterium]|jgi:hypothetical protein|nr:DUF3108 domain-containing protein [Dysgonamonadaceae bacterium]
MKRSKAFGVFVVSILVYSSTLFAQQDLPFQSGEQLDFSIQYKYGIVMVKAGTAQYSIKDHIFRGEPAIRTSLSFKTVGVVDAAYRMKDTLYTHFTPELIPVFHRKYLNEGKTSYIEDIDYKNFSTTSTTVRSKRVRDGDVRFDTLLTAKGVGYDMLGIFTFVRTLDYCDLKPGDTFGLTTFVGRDVVPMSVRYIGQAFLDKGSIKYKALKFGIDIIDPAFTEPKNAMEVWISDDQNHIPLKLRAKLKIGAAEAELTSTKNLKYPFDAKIEIPK